MGRVRTGTVGYSYREWMGIFYPPGLPARRQLQIYGENFDACELTQFTHQMPEGDRVARFAAQVKTDMKFFVRVHNAFTQSADIGLSLTLSRHFRRAIEPLHDAGKLAGLVASFPYAFKENAERRKYIEELSAAFTFEHLPLQLDFRHPSWMSEESFDWMRRRRLGFVCVDEPALPGLIPPHIVATSPHVLVRLHGRNADGWWSGNPATRYDYLYSDAELMDLEARYLPLIGKAESVSFVFQNNWEAHSVRNAMQWKSMFARRSELVGEGAFGIEIAPPLHDARHALDLTRDLQTHDTEDLDEEAGRPPTTLPFAELKSRVSRALSPLQQTMNLPMRNPQKS